jgi:hypothetical protein
VGAEVGCAACCFVGEMMRSWIMQCMITSMLHYTQTSFTDPINAIFLAVDAWYCYTNNKNMVTSIILTYSDGSNDTIGYVFITLI